MENSAVLITGGLGGLGTTFAAACAAEGHDLLLIDRYPQGGPVLAHFQLNYPVNVQYQSCNLADPADRARLVEDLHRSGYSFSGLINVVGWESEGAFLERSRDDILHLLHLNIEAMVDLTHAILQMRDENQRFMLINVASLAGFFPIPYKAVYSSSKKFIINFSLALHKEIQSFADVIVLCPGGLPTTAESMKKIFLQGFWGKMTAHDTSVVVKRTLQKVKRHQPIYIPGLANRFMVGLSKILPERWQMAYLDRRWRTKQAELDLWRLTESQRGK